MSETVKITRDTAEVEIHIEEPLEKDLSIPLVFKCEEGTAQHVLKIRMDGSVSVEGENDWYDIEICEKGNISETETAKV